MSTIRLVVSLITVLGLTSCDRTLSVDENGLPIASSAEDVVELLELSYSTRNPQLFAALLANPDVDGVEYTFVPAPGKCPVKSECALGYHEEVRTVRRLLTPQDPAPGDPVVPEEYWLKAVTLELTPTVPFEPTAEYTRSDTNPDGLDPAIWKVRHAPHDVLLSFDTRSDVDPTQHMTCDLVVIENMTRQDEGTRRFLLYRWKELAAE